MRKSDNDTWKEDSNGTDFCDSAPVKEQNQAEGIQFNSTEQDENNLNRRITINYTFPQIHSNSYFTPLLSNSKFQFHLEVIRGHESQVSSGNKDKVVPRRMSEWVIHEKYVGFQRENINFMSKWPTTERQKRVGILMDDNELTFWVSLQLIHLPTSAPCLLIALLKLS